MKKIAIFLAATLLASSAALAESMPVHVAHSGDDEIGRQLAFEVKEAVRGANSMHLVERNEWPYIRVDLVTLNPDQGRANRTIVSALFQYSQASRALGGLHITSSVGVCGADRLQHCARSVLTSLDSAGSDVRNAAPEYWDRLTR